MIKKIKSLIEEFRQREKRILEATEEVIWANVYHDSIRGKEWLEKLSLNIGRWAGNYTFFYVLNRILNDCKPNSILEFGLGESSKFIATYIKNELKDTHHDIIEQDESWAENFKNNFQLPNNSTIHICPLVEKKVNGFAVNSYQNLEGKTTKSYDFYLIDGPFGSENYSRYDIVSLVEKFPVEHEFILLLDDYNRKGEWQTGHEIRKMLDKKDIKYTATVYKGNKSLLLIATAKYKHLSSI